MLHFGSYATALLPDEALGWQVCMLLYKDYLIWHPQVGMT